MGRIVALGDSFAVGVVPYEQNFLHRRDPGAPLGSAFADEAFRAIELRRLAFARREPDRRTRRAYEYIFSVLDEWIAEVGERLRIVIIPDEYQVNDELYRSLVEPQADQYDREQPTRRLRAFLDKRGVAYVDLLQPLRAAQAVARTYAHNDTHWNQRGNAVAAEQIAHWLEPGGG